MMMNLKRDIYYISVESRKGGVGKTTVSLSLAQNLLAKKYEVLYIDLDLIGTQLTSDFFIGKEKELYEVMWRQQPANLVEIFEKRLSSGINTPIFRLTKTDNDTNVLLAKKGVCNCLGSNIYNMSKGKQSDSVLLDDPRLLYDSFHAFWILETVKSLSQSFAECFTCGSKIAVILDHSPGYSSLESMFHDYLTDLGPEFGKFLLVSSIDAQDLEACRQSVDNLKSIHNDKVEAYRYYSALLNNGDYTPEVKSDYFKRCFSRLCSTCGEFPLVSSETTLTSNSFVSILINKIPNRIYEKVLKKRIKIIHEDEIPARFLSHLQFFFNEWTLKNEGVEMEELKDKVKSPSMAGNLASLIKDHNTYEKKIIKATSGLYGNSFFKSEWAPLSPFKEIVNYLLEQELVDVKVDICKFFKSVQVNEDNISDVVEKFILEVVENSNEVQDSLAYVKKIVAQRIQEAGSDKRVSFHVYPEDSRKLKGLDKLLSLYGIAVYRLMNNEKNTKLISYIVDKVYQYPYLLDQINQDDLSDKINKILEGQAESEKDITEIIEETISSQINLSVLNTALEKALSIFQL